MDRWVLMTSRTLYAGERIFIDSNILTYHLLNHPAYGAACRNLIQTIQDGECQGFITLIVISETLFNFIKADIFRTYGARPGQVASLIKCHPEILRDISLDRPGELFDIFNILPIGKPETAEALQIMGKCGILVNDAHNVAAMKANRIFTAATNDRDFERVKDIKIWAP